MGELKTSQLFTWGQQLLKRVWDDKSTEIFNCAVVRLFLIFQEKDFFYAQIFKLFFRVQVLSNSVLLLDEFLILLLILIFVDVDDFNLLGKSTFWKMYRSTERRQKDMRFLVSILPQLCSLKNTSTILLTSCKMLYSQFRENTAVLGLSFWSMVLLKSWMKLATSLPMEYWSWERTLEKQQQAVVSRFDASAGDSKVSLVMVLPVGSRLDSGRPALLSLSTPALRCCQTGCVCPARSRWCPGSSRRPGSP